MNPELEAAAAKLLASDKVPDEVKAQIRAELQSHTPAEAAPKEASPYLMSDEFGAQAQSAREEGARVRADRRAAVKAGQAEEMFQAREQGRSGLPWAYDKALSLLPAFRDPAAREGLELAGSKDLNDASAAAGDPAAAMTQGLRAVVAPVEGVAAGTAGAGLLGPGGGLARALARGALGGGAGGHAEATGQGASPTEALPSTALSAAAGIGVNAALHGAGALGARAQAALRANPDIGADVKIAEEGGYRTAPVAGLRPTTPTGLTPGKRGVEEQAAALAPEVMGRAGQVDDALVAAHEAADQAFYASETGKKTVTSAPIINAFKKVIDARTFEDKTAIPESMANRLRNDVRAFADVQLVPIEQAEEAARKAGGVAVAARSLTPVSESAGAASPEAALARAGGQAVGPARGPRVVRGEYIPPGQRALPGRPELGPGEGAAPAGLLGGPERALVRARAQQGVGPAAGLPEPAASNYAPPGGGPAGAPIQDVSPEASFPGYKGPLPQPPRGQEERYAYVLVPRNLNARELEAVRNTFDAAGSMANRSTEETAPLREIANAARGMRPSFPGLAALKSGQATEVAGVKNLRKAFGIPEGKRLAPDDLAELKAVGDALQRYRAPGNLESDQVIQKFLADNPEYAPRFQKLAAMSAAERVRGPRPGAPQGSAMRTAGRAALNAVTGQSLHLDPLMRTLARARGGLNLPPAVAGAGAGPGAEWIRRSLWGQNPQEESTP